MLEGLLSKRTAIAGPWSPTALLVSWRRALLDCLPGRLRRLLGRERPTLVLAVAGEDELVVRLDKAGEEQALGRFRSTDLTSLREVLSRLIRENARANILAVPGDVLIRRVQLPAQVKESLGKVLGYEIDRLTPFPASEVYFDYRVLGGGTGTGQLAIELAVLKKSRVQGWVDRLAAAGFSGHVLSWPGAWSGANLFPVAMRRRTDRRSQYVAAMLWVLLLALAAAVAVTPLWQKRSNAIDLGDRLARARHQAAEVADLKGRLQEAAQSANFVFRQKHSSLYTVELLRILTELVPDNSWIFQLDVKDGKVEIRGESRQATNLIEILTQEPTFRNVVFKSPVVGVKNTDRERFHIEFQYAVTGGGS